MECFVDCDLGFAFCVGGRAGHEVLRGRVGATEDGGPCEVEQFWVVEGVYCVFGGVEEGDFEMLWSFEVGVRSVGLSMGYVREQWVQAGKSSFRGRLQDSTNNVVALLNRQVTDATSWWRHFAE